MSHDRGCSCGREKWDYATCSRTDCLNNKPEPKTPENHDPNGIQHGGVHYQATYQHWDWAENNGLGYLESAATKYVARWRTKGVPILDLEKAGHYVQKLMALFLAGTRKPRGHAPVEDTVRFCAANNLISREQHFCILLSSWSQEADLERALELIDQLLVVAAKEYGS